ncbi:MAG: TldD/PmbA family protein, partial [bacterium]
NTIHQNVARETATLCLRAVRGKRIGCVRTGVLTEAGLRQAAEGAAAIADAAGGDPEFPGIVESPAAEPLGIFDDETADCSPGRRAEIAREVIERIEAGGAVASGSVSTEAAWTGLASTAGTRQFDRETDLGLNVVAMADTAAGCAEFSGPRLSDADPGDRAEFALRKCLDSRDPGEVEPGEYPVVLEPAAAAVLFQFLGRLAFSAQDMQQGRSCLQGKLGERVFDDRITLVDDPHDPAGSPFGFDGEGVPTGPVILVENGVFRSVVHDLKTAAKDGVRSTGHGGIPPNPGGPSLHTRLVSPGESTPDELMASTDRGLLVSRFHYTNVAERATAQITGMTRYGLFEIAGGELAGPVRNLRFTQSIIEALRHVEGVGRDRERLGSTVVPALKIRSFRFTGKSDH